MWSTYMYQPDTESDDVLDNTSFEIEEIDDTPESDKGRTPIDHDPTDEHHSQDDDKFTPDVQARVNKLTHAIHTERRAKEQRERELAEAVEYARRVSSELTASRKQTVAGEKAYVAQVKTSVDLELDRAEEAVEKAYEAGDPKRLARAQRDMAVIAARKQVVDAYIPMAEEEAEFESIPEPAPTPQNVPRQPTTATQDWVARNPWFHRDQAKTQIAFDIHAELVNDGVAPDSPRYFRELDAEIKRRSVPRETSTQPPVASGRTGQRPATRKVQLTKAEVAIANQMGISLQDYAKEKIRLGY